MAFRVITYERSSRWMYFIVLVLITTFIISMITFFGKFANDTYRHDLTVNGTLHAKAGILDSPVYLTSGASPSLGVENHNTTTIIEKREDNFQIAVQPTETIGTTFKLQFGKRTTTTTMTMDFGQINTPNISVIQYNRDTAVFSYSNAETFFDTPTSYNEGSFINGLFTGKKDLIITGVVDYG